jgi:hypothetical protein
MELATGSEGVEATTPIGQIRGEALTLIQTQKIVEFPVILMGEAYWRPVCAFLQRMVREGTISESALKLLLVTDSVKDAAAHIQTMRSSGSASGGAECRNDRGYSASEVGTHDSVHGIE